jgi:hypothetical protein
MNLEQIVKETVAKIVAEKELTAAEEKKREEIVKAMKKDFKGPAPAMYAIATDKAKKLAEDGIDEAVLTEDMSLLSAVTLIVSAAALGGNIGALAAHFSDTPDKIKQWWKDRKDDKAVKSIIAKIKSDPEMIEFFKMSQTQQRGKFRKLVASKLSAEELQYLNRINKGDLQQNELNEDYEVAMAQDSLDSIIRAAMMLKAQMGDQEVNLPAWIQDHITNSENYINQAAKGYHESDAQIDDEAGAEEMDEANLGHNETSSIEQEGRFWVVTYQTADGTKEKSFESEDKARAFYNTLDEAFVPKSSFDD